MRYSYEVSFFIYEVQELCYKDVDLYKNVYVIKCFLAPSQPCTGKIKGEDLSTLLVKC